MVNNDVPCVWEESNPQDTQYNKNAKSEQTWKIFVHFIPNKLQKRLANFVKMLFLSRVINF